MSDAALTCCFVVPVLDGPISGGTLYNHELCAALAERSCSVSVCALGDPQLESRLASADYGFVDTLYLAALPELARRTRKAPVLLTHYLPTFVTAGRAVTSAELSEPESRALGAARACLVTSDFMREAMEPLVAPKQAIFVVQPGSRAQLAPEFARPVSGMRALLIANLLPGKRVAPLLAALGAALRREDRFELSIIGRLDADPAYAAHCARLIRASPALSARVTLHGACSPERTLASLAESDLLLSASAMESYGMALSEARVTGVPIVACAGGHSAAHVDPVTGGQLVSGPEALAAACLELVRAPESLAERCRRARLHAPNARPWALAAQELLDQLARREK